jgi:hypothetical protein
MTTSEAKDFHRLVSISTPFAVDSVSEDVTYTYMDTTGHPTIVLNKHAVSDVHNQDILVRSGFLLSFKA